MNWTETAHSIKGNFSLNLHPAKLFAGFLKAKKNGVLSFRDGVVDAAIFLKDGCVVFVPEAVFASLDFGRYLISKDVITLSNFRHIAAEAEKNKRPIVDVMIDEEAIDREEAASFAKQYYWETVGSLFSWRRGVYRFYDEEIGIPEQEASRVGTAELILENTAEQYNPLTVHKRLKDRLTAALKINPDSFLDPDELRSLPDVKKILDAIRDDRPMQKVIKTAFKDQSHGMAIVFGLLTLGVLKFIVPREARKKIVLERKARRSRDPLQRLFHEAEKGVDRIHEEAKAQPPPREVEVTLAGNDQNLEETEGELRNKLQRILDLKRQRRTIIEERIRTEGTSGEIPSLAAIFEPAPPPEAGGEAPGVSPETESGIEEEVLTDEEGDAELPFDESEFDFGLLDEEEPDEAKEDLQDDQTTLKNIDPEEGFIDGFNDQGFGQPGKATFGPEETIETILGALKGFCEEERWEDAEAAFSELVFREYDEADAMALGGWARYHLPGKDPFATGASLIQKAIEKDPKMDLPFLLMGRIYMEENDKGMAELYFVKAIEVNLDCIEAKELLKEIYRTD